MRWIAFASAICCLHIGGCSYFQTTSVTAPSDGLTLVLPGIEGESFVNSNIAQGLADGKVAGEIEIFEWTSGNALRSLEHLSDGQRVQVQSERLAARIEQSQREDPQRPISIVAHSGGAGVVLGALERVPLDRPVATVVLIAPAVSSGYPVGDVADKTASGIWSFNSPLDFQLTVGTSVAGTIDREFAPAAGGVGFDSQAAGLIQIPHDPTMIFHGNLGGHNGATNPLFVRERIAPIIRQAQDAAHLSGNLRRDARAR